MCDFIRSARLDRCRRDLLDPAFADQPISAIASRWGLPSAPHFSRLFRQAYGCSPREFRRDAAVAAESSDGVVEDVPTLPPARWPLELGEPWAAGAVKSLAGRPRDERQRWGGSRDRLRRWDEKRDERHYEAGRESTAALELDQLTAGYDRAAVVRDLA